MEKADGQGQVTTLRREDWSPFEPDIVASNGLIHNDLINVINKNALLTAFMQLYLSFIRPDIRNRGRVDRALNLAKEGIVFLRKKDSGK